MNRVTSTYPYLNLGCGGRFDRDWTNIDFRPGGPGVIRHDLIEGLPFPDCSFSAVYHSHVLEHLSPEQGRRLLQECFRVLRPGGILRIVVPDLEDAVRAYLDALNRARTLDPVAQANHSWMLTELVDQMTRTVPGGRMRALLEDPMIPNPDFVVWRLGGQAVSAFRRAGTAPRNRFQTLLTKLRDGGSYSRYIAAAGRAALDVFHRVLIGRRNWEALKVGRFRLRSGEVHQWMYDSVSLTRLLNDCGFTGATVQSAHSSFIAGWADFHLDAERDRSVWLPNSLYLEARRPSAGA